MVGVGRRAASVPRSSAREPTAFRPCKGSCGARRRPRGGLAAEEGAEQIVELLLTRGAETALAASDGSTALMRACDFGHEQCARALLEAKANLEAQQNQGFTALMLLRPTVNRSCMYAVRP